MKVELASPFPLEALPRIWRWVESFRDQISDDFGPQTLDEFVEAARARWDQQTTWAIYGAGELGGLIAFERLSPWLGTAHWVLKPDFQGQGVALQASRIAVAAMFALGIGKLSVYPLAGNRPMGSLLIRLGAQREGTLAEQTVCHGRPVDMWVYGLTRAAFEKAKPVSLEVPACPG